MDFMAAKMIVKVSTWIPIVKFCFVKPWQDSYQERQKCVRACKLLPRIQEKN